jgi:flagellar L-ring protein FlgH
MASVKGYQYYKSGIISIAVMFIAACTPIGEPPINYPPVLPIDNPPPPKRGGTIYQRGHNIRLYDDRIAHRIGDVLTIRLEEATQGEYQARTRTEKRAKLDYPLPIMFGKPVPSLVVNTDTQQSFDGNGRSDQSNRLRGTITVTVTRVLSNENLIVQGESWVSINQGQEYIQLTGIVRPEDILPNNTISSQRIAGAQITYGARGQAGYASRGGLMTKIFNQFFPY